MVAELKFELHFTTMRPSCLWILNNMSCFCKELGSCHKKPLKDKGKMEVQSITMKMSECLFGGHGEEKGENEGRRVDFDLQWEHFICVWVSMCVCRSA